MCWEKKKGSQSCSGSFPGEKNCKFPPIDLSNTIVVTEKSEIGQQFTTSALLLAFKLWVTFAAFLLLGNYPLYEALVREMVQITNCSAIICKDFAVNSSNPPAFFMSRE